MTATVILKIELILHEWPTFIFNLQPDNYPVMARRQHKVKTTPSSLPALNTDTYPGPQSLTGLTVCVSAAEVPAANTHQGQEAGPLSAFTFGHLEPLSTYHKFRSLGSRAVFLCSRSLLPFPLFISAGSRTVGHILH